LSQDEKNEQQAAQEKAMMGGLRTNRQDLKRRREEELRVIAEKKLRIEQNELMQKQIAAALGSQCSQCSQS
jgi:predicted XRE-type DNA-binding protein